MIVFPDDVYRLYQWDTNHIVYLLGDARRATEIHFAAANKVYIGKIETNSSGEVFARIPNELLKGSYPITIYTYFIGDSFLRTGEHITFNVVARPKPPQTSL